MKKTSLPQILLSAMIFSLFVANSAQAAGKLVFKYGSSAEYQHSINAMRQQVAVPFKGWKNIKQTPVTAGITLLSFPDSKTDVNLVVNDRDLYIVGFTSKKTFYRLKDKAFAKISVPGDKTIELKLSPHYNDLERLGKVKRASVVVNDGTITKALKVFADYDVKKPSEVSVASSVVVLAIGLPEAMRFTNIEKYIADNWFHGTSLGAALANQTNVWSGISGYADALAADPKSKREYLRPHAETITRANLPSYLSVALNPKVGKPS